MLLLDRSDCQLVVIDIQTGFYPPSRLVDRERLAGVTATAAWLTGVATALGVPVTVTEEDPARNGPTAPSVLDLAPAATEAILKPVFGLADTPAVLSAIEAHRRQTAVLVGMETDVCVTHSALGLLERGYRVAVVTDATFSPGAMHELGLRRIADAGVVLVHAKGLYYEWVRTLEEARRFEVDHPELAEQSEFSL